MKNRLLFMVKRWIVSGFVIKVADLGTAEHYVFILWAIILPFLLDLYNVTSNL
jgi:hypothetical protein